MSCGYSVLMSVYIKEKADYLVTAVDSMLQQTVPPEDFVIVCDGPLTAELDAVIERYADQYPKLFQIVRLPENLGLGRALARGVCACRCEIIARMDSDDYADPHRMQWQLQLLDENERLDVVGGNIAEFENTVGDATYCRKVPVTDLEIRRRLPKRNPMNHMTVTYRKSAVLASGNYEDFLWHEDYHLWAKMLKAGHVFQNVDRICVFARANSGFYKRRSGMRFFRQSVKMQKYLLENGWMSYPRYCLNILIRFVGIVVISGRTRKALYRLMLREKRTER